MRELRDALGHTCGSLGTFDHLRGALVISTISSTSSIEIGVRPGKRIVVSCVGPGQSASRLCAPSFSGSCPGFAAAILHDRDCRRSGQTRKRTCRHRQEQLRDCAGADIAGNQCRRRADFRRNRRLHWRSCNCWIDLVPAGAHRQSDGCGAQGQRSAYLAKARARPARDRGTKPDEAQASLVERALS